MFELEVVTSNAAQRIGQLAEQAECLRAAVAYWTLPPRCVDSAFKRALAHPKGFLCTDIHYPTSIDELASFKNEGANVFLYLYALSGKAEVKSAKGGSDHLLHSKVFLFDYANDSAIAWIGSHNGTYRALYDVNTECSVVITLDQHSALYAQIRDHLDSIWKVSTEFCIGDIEYYKMLQGQSGGDDVIELEDASQSGLQLGSRIIIFGSIPREFDRYKKVGTGIYLRVTQSHSDNETFYKATIDQTGNLERGGGVRFASSRYAMREGQQLPELCLNGEIPEAIYQRAQYFLTLIVQSCLPPNTIGLEVVRPDASWEEIPVNEYRDKIVCDIDSKDHLTSVDGKSLRIKQPATKEKMSKDMLMTLEDRKKLKDHALIRKLIIVQR